MDRGFKDIQREAQEKLDALEGHCFGNDAKKYTFYKAITIVCEAAMLLPKRYAAACREQAAGDVSEERRAELLSMADSLDWILENPAAPSMRRCSRSSSISCCSSWTATCTG